VNEFPVYIIGLWGLLDENLILVPVKFFRVFSLTLPLLHINLESLKYAGLIFI